MFMNKINMPQTCPYNCSCKQAIKLLQTTFEWHGHDVLFLSPKLLVVNRA